MHMHSPQRDNQDPTSPLRDESQPAHAVCVTGLERSFVAIGDNVRQGILRFLGTPSIKFFGVRPRQDNWTMIRQLFPVTENQIELQTWCYSSDAELNLTSTWQHCDARARAHDCRRAFLQALCDLAHCEAMIRAHELSRRGHFKTITRLRPDLFWEAVVEAPVIDVIDNTTVYVPASDSQGGINDHLAYGGRWAMQQYLTRGRYIMTAPTLAKTLKGSEWNMKHLRRGLKGANTEQFLQLTLRLDGVRGVPMRDWMYCYYRGKPHWSDTHGCVGRTRCRSPCRSLHCDRSGARSGECACSNQTCAEVRASGRGPFRHHFCGKGGRMSFGVFGNAAPRMSHTPCVDVIGRQLFHSCPDRTLDSLSHQALGPSSTRSEADDQTCWPACPWPLGPDGKTPISYTSLDQLPRCVLPSMEKTSALAVDGRCDAQRTREVKSQGGVFAIRPLALKTPRPACKWELQRYNDTHRSNR